MHCTSFLSVGSSPIVHQKIVHKKIAHVAAILANLLLLLTVLPARGQDGSSSPTQPGRHAPRSKPSPRPRPARRSKSLTNWPRIRKAIRKTAGKTSRLPLLRRRALLPRLAP